MLSNLGNRKFNPTGICDEGDGLVAVLLALITEREKTVQTWNILQGKTHFSGHLFMSGIYNVGYCAMTWCDFRNVSSGVRTLFFQQIQHDNKPCEREAKWATREEFWALLI